MCIPEEKGNYILLATDLKEPKVNLVTGKGKTALEDILNLSEMIDVKGWKAIGNKFAGADLQKLELLEPDPEAEAEEVIAEETIVNDDLFKEEQERIKKLLEDDDADTFEKKKPIKKADPGKDDQPKLF